MTFSELLLEARYHLYDIRKIDGTLITLATEDGIRWTSNLLVSIVRNALIDMARTLVANKLENNIAYDVNTRIVDCSIKTGSAYGVLYIPTAEETNFYKVINIQEGLSSSIYNSVSDESFFDMVWRNSQVTVGTGSIVVTSDAIVRKCFTTVYDTTDKTIKTLVLPNPSTEIEKCKAVIKCSLETLYTLASTTPLPFINSVDLALDFIEYHAYKKQYAPAQMQVLKATIQEKIAEMKL